MVSGRLAEKNGYYYMVLSYTEKETGKRASLMVANGEQMKTVQEWLGHSDIGTTANIYSHLDFQSKVSAAATMQNALPIPENFEPEKW